MYPKYELGWLMLGMLMAFSDISYHIMSDPIRSYNVIHSVMSDHVMSSIAADQPSKSGV